MVLLEALAHPGIGRGPAVDRVHQADLPHALQPAAHHGLRDRVVVARLPALPLLLRYQVLLDLSGLLVLLGRVLRGLVGGPGALVLGALVHADARVERLRRRQLSLELPDAAVHLALRQVPVQSDVLVVVERRGDGDLDVGEVVDGARVVLPLGLLPSLRLEEACRRGLVHAPVVERAALVPYVTRANRYLQVHVIGGLIGV